MPKSVKKSCITQASISRYFVEVNSRDNKSPKEKSAEQLSRKKVHQRTPKHALVVTGD